MPPSASPEAAPAHAALQGFPYQFARIAYLVVGWAMIAGVHSTVWIFAIRAACDQPRLVEELGRHPNPDARCARRSADGGVLEREQRVQEPRPTQKLPATR